jgi:uncharacterized protein YsxB (DUF464 family)
VIRINAQLADGLFRLVVDGHEEHAEGGRVCAAVSAVTQTALLGLQQIAEQHPDIVSVNITQEN